ncbi:poliovirus receptor homolog [Sorex fumeus]|uniref:poliovirus receptor homolog n=1 Tax=Sorex fumeus TaxID=62283 RepID=UPI0024AE1087|nr:poliovirus receptor homolog [Sorex fumeus]XP_055992033.1 poliovirus receptor homolog [Sorex fumeus]XP_055992034.1 poliovirus receptor homolog [Sorex fumeus]XP_055992035.1 poliovirus receptor homolog [Sorex fumeus]
MAQSPTLPGLTLLLPLLLQLLQSWASTRAGTRKVVVLAPVELRGSLGDTLTLPCHLQSLDSKTQRVTLISWKRLDSLGDPSIVAEFHREQGPSIPEADRVEFKAARLGADLLDASLTIRELSPGDEANYTCEIHISPSQMGSASTWLRVFYAPQVSIALYDDTGQQGQREISLTCDARSNPEPKSYNWSTTTGPLPPSAAPQGSQLLIQPTEESINTTFICHVSNDLGTGQAAMRVLIPGSPREPSPSYSALQIGLCVSGIVLVAVLGAMVYSRYRRQSRQDSHSGPDHRAVSYETVQREASASQDPLTEDTDGLT